MGSSFYMQLSESAHCALNSFVFKLNSVRLIFVISFMFLQASLKEKEDKNKTVLIQARSKLQQLTGMRRKEAICSQQLYLGLSGKKQLKGAIARGYCCAEFIAQCPYTKFSVREM